MLSAIIEQTRNTFLASKDWAVIITYADSKISYFGNNDLSLPQFRPGTNDSKNRSKRLETTKIQDYVFGPVFEYLTKYTGLLKSNYFKGTFNDVML